MTWVRRFAAALFILFGLVILIHRKGGSVANKLPVVFLISCLCVLSTKPVAGEKKELPYASSSIDALRSNLLAHPKDIKLRCGLIKRIIEEDLDFFHMMIKK